MEDVLTDREREVVALAASGMTNDEIGRRLGISRNAVRFHLKAAHGKLHTEGDRSRFARFVGAGALVLATLTVATLAVSAFLVYRGGEGDNAGAQADASATGGVVNPTVPATPDEPAALAECPPTVLATPVVGVSSAIDWVPAVRFNGTIYHPARYWSGSSPDVPTSLLGAAVGRVAFTLQNAVHDPNYRLKDCDATFLPEGTLFYRVDGYDPRFRIAFEDGTLYQALVNESARTGRDLLDLEGKVTSVELLLPGEQIGTHIVTTTDPAEISTLVDGVLSAAVDYTVGTRNVESTRFHVIYGLADGTKFGLTYDVESLFIWPGLRPTDDFQYLVDQLTGIAD